MQSSLYEVYWNLCSMWRILHIANNFYITKMLKQRAKFRILKKVLGCNSICRKLVLSKETMTGFARQHSKIWTETKCLMLVCNNCLRQKLFSYNIKYKSFLDSFSKIGLSKGSLFMTNPVTDSLFLRQWRLKHESCRQNTL